MSQLYEPNAREALSEPHTSNTSQENASSDTVKGVLTDILGTLPKISNRHDWIERSLIPHFPLRDEEVARLVKLVHLTCHKSPQEYHFWHYLTFGVAWIVNGAIEIGESISESLSNNKIEAKVLWENGRTDLMMGGVMSAFTTASVWGFLNILTIPEIAAPVAGSCSAGLFFSIVSALAIHLERERVWVKNTFSKDPLIEDLSIHLTREILQSTFQCYGSITSENFCHTLGSTLKERPVRDLVALSLNAITSRIQSSGSDLALQYSVVALIGTVTHNLTLALAHLGQLRSYPDSWPVADQLLPLVEGLVIGELRQLY